MKLPKLPKDDARMRNTTWILVIFKYLSRAETSVLKTVFSNINTLVWLRSSQLH